MAVMANMARLVVRREIECAYVYVLRWRKYGELDVDLLICQDRGHETLDIAREIVKLLYDRVISRSNAWTRVFLKHSSRARKVLRYVREFVDRKSKSIPLYHTGNPIIWIVASPSHVGIRAERHLIEEVVGEVEKLLEAKLLKPMKP